MKKLSTEVKGVQLITHYEQYHDGNLSKIGLQPKECPSGIWTVGLGHALTNENGAFLRGTSGLEKAKKLYPKLMTMTIQEANDLLAEDLIIFEKIVNNKLKVEVSQDQFDALVSHTFNTGGSDTLFNLVNKHQLEQAINWFTTHYITSNGVPMKGLKYRRRTEALLFSTGELKFYN